jgi:hypothetical protein
VIEHPTTWKNVQMGHYIQDKRDNIWRVDDLDLQTDLVHLVGAEGKVGQVQRPPAHTPVTILILNTVEILEQELGAKEVTS